MSSLIGRTAYTRAIEAAMARCAGGASQIVVLRGAAGIGKTALLDFAARSAPAGALLLRASGHEAEVDLPYAGLHQLLGPVRDEVSALPEPHRGHLNRALAYERGAPADPTGVDLRRSPARRRCRVPGDRGASGR